MLTRFRLPVAIAVGLVAFSAAAGAAEAAAAPWTYVVTGVSGSATWQYRTWNGSGADSVKFHGSLRRGSAGKASRAASALSGTATYTDQNSRGCGPVASTRTMSFGDGLGFVVQSPNVDVTWDLPLPGQSRCYIARLTHFGTTLRQDGFLSEQMPLARFACPAVVFTLRGHVRYAGRGAIGSLTFKATVTLEER